MISLAIASAANLYVLCLPGVWIKEINPEFLTVAVTLSRELAKQGLIAVLTGAAEARTDVEILHTAGYAWDWRSREVASPEVFAAKLNAALQAIDPRFRVIYTLHGTGAHFHTEYRNNLTAEP
jgi:hypothetical protein